MLSGTENPSTYSKKNNADIRVLVVGGGLGGMACAARLARAGLSVTLLERNSTLGGKVAEQRAAGFRWDIGPSLLTLPEALHDLGRYIGHPPPHLHRLESACRYVWPDGHTLDADAEFMQQPEVASFLQHTEGIYALSGEAFLKHPPTQFWRAFRPSNWPLLRHLPKLTTFKTLSQDVRMRFQDPHLIQLFERYATYNGSDPRHTPATFNVIPYVEHAFGAWYPEGGIRALARWLELALCALGVEVLSGETVREYDGSSLRTDSGKSWRPDIVICNGEVQRAYRDWIRLPGSASLSRKMDRPTRSLSGYVLLLGLDQKQEALAHHNIFFSENYHAEFDDLFIKKRFPSDPTLYLNVSCRTDPADAPAGGDNIFILANAPAHPQSKAWSELTETYNNHILDKLEAMGINAIRGHIVHMENLTPDALAERDLSTHGALYGAASHGLRASLLRPPLRSPLDDKLFFVGGSTHPGGGIPLVLYSAQMAAEAVLRSRGY